MVYALRFWVTGWIPQIPDFSGRRCQYGVKTGFVAIKYIDGQGLMDQKQLKWEEGDKIATFMGPIQSDTHDIGQISKGVGQGIPKYLLKKYF